MIEVIKRINRYLLLGAHRRLLLGVIFTISGLAILKGCEYFPESTFELASESRLPKWVTLPPGLTQANVSLTMNYYAVPWSHAQFILRDERGHILKKENGRMRCGVPAELKNPSQGFPPGYPAYQAITVNGITEIIEHRKMEPIFYVTDDIAVWKRYELMGC